jgi:tRNA-dihydrouridine synthase
MSKVPAHWEYAHQLVKLRNEIAPKTLLVGNGDVMSRAEGEALAKQYKLDGIMIGRGVFHDPLVFAKRSNWDRVGEAERIALLRQHVALFAATWQNGERPIHTLNKFSKLYISGFDGAKELRERCMATQSPEALLALLT